MSSEEVTTSGSSDGKKNTKPIMEKRRRARINSSLVELKALLMDVIKSEGTIHSKMEKADILEMTVRHLRSLQNQYFPDNVGLRSFDNAGKFSLGYTECISEVGKFLNSLDIEEIDLKTKIIDHLANCVTRSRSNESDIEMFAPTRPLSSFSSLRVVPQTLVVNTHTSKEDIDSQVQIAADGNRSNHDPNKANEQCDMEGDETQSTSISTSDVISNVSSNQQYSSRLTGLTKKEAAVPEVGTTLKAVPTSGTAASSLKAVPTSGSAASSLKAVPTSDSAASTESPISYTSALSQLSPMLNQPQVINLQNVQVSQPLTYPNISVSPIPTQLFSGLQIVPTTLSGKEVAFVVPANILTTTGNVFATMAAPSYVVPVYKMEVESSALHKPDTASQVPVVTSSDHVTGSKSIAVSTTTDTSEKYPFLNQSVASVTKHSRLDMHTYQPYDLSKRPLHPQSGSSLYNIVTSSDFGRSFTSASGSALRNCITNGSNGTPKETFMCLQQGKTLQELNLTDTSTRPSRSVLNLTDTSTRPSRSVNEHSTDKTDNSEQSGSSSSDMNQSDDVWRPW